MKTLLLTLGLLGITTLTHAQGTIAFGNSALTRMTIRSYPDGTLRNCTAADNLVIGVFYGPAGSSADQLVLAPGLARIGTTDGVFIGSASVFSLPGTDGGQLVSLQIRAWWADFGMDANAAQRSGYYYSSTDVRQVTLGPTAGPGAVIWQSAAGISPVRFYPMNPVVGVPEPSTMALGALAGAFLLFRLRKTTKPN